MGVAPSLAAASVAVTAPVGTTSRRTFLPSICLMLPRAASSKQVARSTPWLLALMATWDRTSVGLDVKTAVTFSCSMVAHAGGCTQNKEDLVW